MAYTNIDDPSAYFQTLLWTGNSTDARALTNDGNSDLQPDWVWLKNRNAGYNHFLQDSSRGNTKVLSSDSTAAESTFTNMVESFDTNGFTIGFDGSQVPNFNGNTFVAWQWKANGGTTSSNTDGSINSTVQANQDAGFSIVTYTGNGSTADQTIGHGLGVRANAVIVKNRDAAANWVVWSEGVDANHSLELNTTDGISDSTQGRVLSNAGSRGTSTIFSIRSGSGSVIQTNTSGEDYVAYCFAEKQGYSKFGKYVGDEELNGPFVYTGFKPAFIMIKSLGAVGWWMGDTKRSTYNVEAASLYPNATDAEYTGTAHKLDFLSNGFKQRNNNTRLNAHAVTYIYMAFAENPFVTSTDTNSIPTTAR